MHTKARRRWRIPALIAVIAVVGIGVTLAIVLNSPPSCGCAIPPSDDAALRTAERYVQSGASDPDDLLHADADAPTTERTAELAELDGPDTEWVVVETVRHGEDHGRSPAERLIVGIGASGNWAALVVHTSSDYGRGTVDPNVDESGELTEFVHRSGPFPVFGDVQATYPSSPELTVIDLEDGAVPVERLGHKAAWAYTGTEALDGERYLLVQASQHYQTEHWIVGSLWWAPQDPADADSD